MLFSEQTQVQQTREGMKKEDFWVQQKEDLWVQHKKKTAGVTILQTGSYIVAVTRKILSEMYRKYHS